MTAPAISRRSRDRGVSASVQWTLLAPVVMLAVLGMIQAGVVLHARTTVRQAAMAAAEAESLLGAQVGDGRAVAQRVIAPVGLQQVSTTIVRGRGTVEVTITGRAPLFFDLGLGRVEGHAVMPLEGP
ncbi:TadE family protein [Aestuariimicrobium soli]|uniref:TadE family protein n=1 Tax=Aestuariimicrobium soli TaxID=2035834 RepID=UPI003EBDF365